MLLYYVRHGDPIYSPNQLTSLGMRQAAAVAKRLACCEIDRIYCSPSIRARQTAQPLCALLKKEPQLLEWCDEVYAWEKLSLTDEQGRRWCTEDQQTKRLFAMEEVRRLGRNWHAHPVFAGKEYGREMDRIQRETDSFLASLGYQHDLQNNCYYVQNPRQEKVVLFAHAGTGAAILSCMLDIPYPIFAPKFIMGHTGVTVVSFPEEEEIVFPEMLTYSNDSHLYEDELPTRY